MKLYFSLFLGPCFAHLGFGGWTKKNFYQRPRRPKVYRNIGISFIIILCRYLIIINGTFIHISMNITVTPAKGKEVSNLLKTKFQLFAHFVKPNKEKNALQIRNFKFPNIYFEVSSLVLIHDFKNSLNQALFAQRTPSCISEYPLQINNSIFQ